EFNRPSAIAVDSKNGYAYVADVVNRRFQRLDTETGNFRVNWRPGGAGLTPAAVTVDSRGGVYAANSTPVQGFRGTVFDNNGARLTDDTAPASVGSPWTPASDNAHMKAPAYVASAPAGGLLVSDTGNNRVLIFERQAAVGLRLAAKQPPTAGLNAPVGVGRDADGNIFVVNSGASNIHSYDASLVARPDIGSAGAGANQFNHPLGLAIVQRTEPLLYVADRDNDRVQIVKRDGTFVRSINTDGTTAFKKPEDVAVDSLGNVYIADTGNRRIVQFSPTDAFVRAITAGAPHTFKQPCGVAVDSDNKLLVTDREQKWVLRLEATGNVLSCWNLDCLVRQSTNPRSSYYPELERMLVYDAPNRAVMDNTGLLAVADTRN